MSRSQATPAFVQSNEFPSHSHAAKRVVYVIDDNVDVRKSLHFALEFSGITVWPFGSPHDFLDQLDSLRPAPILLDVRMPKIDGIQLLEMIRSRGINWPVIMMTAHGDVPIAVAAMKLRASDFLEKPFPIDRLEELLAVAYSQLNKIVEISRHREAGQAKFASLSPREREVAAGLAQGKSSKIIAIELGISPRTVEIHRAAVLTKLEVERTSGAVRLLTELGKI